MSAKDSGEKKQRLILIEVRQEITEKHEHGMQGLELARQYDRSTSTVCTVMLQSVETVFISLRTWSGDW